MEDFATVEGVPEGTKETERETGGSEASKRESDIEKVYKGRKKRDTERQKVGAGVGVGRRKRVRDTREAWTIQSSLEN